MTTLITLTSMITKTTKTAMTKLTSVTSIRSNKKHHAEHDHSDHLAPVQLLLLASLPDLHPELNLVSWGILSILSNFCRYIPLYQPIQTIYLPLN